MRTTFTAKVKAQTNLDPESPLPNANGTQGQQILFACILILPEDAAPVLSLLQQLTSNSPKQTSSAAALAHPELSPQARRDQWLQHSEAADYLGISKSTLYRYSCEGRIENRKLGTRLEYRRSTLEYFKEQRIRPARQLPRRGIITPTLGSGK